MPLLSGASVLVHIASAVLFAPPDGASEGDDTYRTVVTPEDPDGLAAQRRLDARNPGFATAVNLDRETGARPADALAEVLSRQPGVTVRSIGGLGQFSSVSLRGSSPQQVQVFLEGVPVGGSFGGSSNLADLPLDQVQRVEVFRGHVPIRFGGAAIGGVVDLVGRDTPTTTHGGSATVGGGSFVAREVRGAAHGPLGPRARYAVRIGYAGSAGDFSFYDTNGTPQLIDDDGEGTRRNNGYDRTLAQLRFDGRTGDWRWSAQQLGTFRRQGIPGPATAQSTQTQLDTAALRTIGKVERVGFVGPGGSLTWLASVGLDQRTFSDPLGEVGLGIDDQRTRSADTYVSPRLRIPVWSDAFLGVVADQRSEFVGVDERAGATAQPDVPSGDAQRRRHAFGAGVQLEQWLWDLRVLLVPGLRVDGLESRFAVAPGSGDEAGETGQDRRDFGFTPRMGARITIIDGLDVRGSVGRYFRPPTLLELFGDRGYIVGEEGLVPERGTSVDGGLVYDRAFGAHDRFGIYTQLSGFGRWAQDLIQWVQAGPVVKPANLTAARIRGLEAAVDVRLWHRAVVVQANYTLMDTVNRSPEANQNGQPLPGRPLHQAFARGSTGWVWASRGIPIEPRVFYTVEFIARNFLDPSGRLDVPDRLLQGAGFELHVDRRIHTAFEARNLMDRQVAAWIPPVGSGTPVPTPISDFIGYPLPGRSFWGSVAIDF